MSARKIMIVEPNDSVHDEFQNGQTYEVEYVETLKKAAARLDEWDPSKKNGPHAIMMYRHTKLLQFLKKAALSGVKYVVSIELKGPTAIAVDVYEVELGMDPDLSALFPTIAVKAECVLYQQPSGESQWCCACEVLEKIWRDK